MEEIMEKKQRVVKANVEICLEDILRKVSLGGLIEVCILNKDGSIAVANDTNTVFVYIVPKRIDDFEKIPHDLGIRNLSDFFKFLNYKTNRKVKITDADIIIKGAGTKAIYHLADESILPRIANPTKIIKDFSSRCVVKAVIVGDVLVKFKELFNLIKPEVITFNCTNKKLIFEIGESIGNRAQIDIDNLVTGVAGKKVPSVVTATYKSNHIQSVFDAVTTSKFEIMFGTETPVVVSEVGKEGITIWCVAPNVSE